MSSSGGLGSPELAKGGYGPAASEETVFTKLLNVLGLGRVESLCKNVVEDSGLLRTLVADREEDASLQALDLFDGVEVRIPVVRIFGIEQGLVGDLHSRVGRVDLAKVVKESMESEGFGQLNDRVGTLDQPLTSLPLSVEVEGLVSVGENGRGVVQGTESEQVLGEGAMVKAVVRGLLTVVLQPMVDIDEGGQVVLKELLVLGVVVPVGVARVVVVRHALRNTVLNHRLRDVTGGVFATQRDGRKGRIENFASFVGRW